MNEEMEMERERSGMGRDEEEGDGEELDGIGRRADDELFAFRTVKRQERRAEE